VINQTVGDAISGVLLVEAVLRYNWEEEAWCTAGRGGTGEEGMWSFAGMGSTEKDMA
jgi:hypothetical protein